MKRIITINSNQVPKSIETRNLLKEKLDKIEEIDNERISAKNTPPVDQSENEKNQKKTDGHKLQKI